MRRNPNVELLESLLEHFLDVPHLLPILGRVFHVEAHANQAVFVNRALIEPMAADGHGVGARRAESGNKLIVRFDELVVFDRPTVIVEQRQQDFEPDRLQPSPLRR